MRGLYTHFPPHEPYIVTNGSCPPHNAPSFSLVYYHLRMYTSTWYSSSPLCEHRIIHRYGTYGLMCMYTSHICGLMPTNTVIFIMHVCGNALHIGTQINCMSKLNCRMCIKKTGQDRGFPISIILQHHLLHRRNLLYNTHSH